MAHTSHPHRRNSIGSQVPLLHPLLRLAITVALIPELAVPVAGFAQETSPPAGSSTTFDSDPIPDESNEEGRNPEPTPITPWWQTNQPPSELAQGPQLGTDLLSILNPTFSPVPPLPAGAEPPGTPRALRWGPVTAHPHLSYSASYGNGLPGAQNQDEKTFINTVSPGIRLDIGKRWFLDYTPSVISYTADGYDNTVNQNVTVSGLGTAGDWDLAFGNQFAITDNPLVQTGVQTQQTLNTTSLGGTRPITPVLSVDLGVSQALRWSEDFNNTFSWSTMNGVNYRLRPNLSVGADIGLGYDLVTPGNNMSNERFMVSVAGQLGRKFTYNFSGGFEVRQFLETDASMKVSPLMNMALRYPITEKTLITLQASRQVSPSYFDNQFAESASLSGGISQRFFGRFYLNVNGGYQWTDNNSTFDPTVTEQTQNYAFVQVSVGSRILRRGSASIFYSWNSGDATETSLNFNSNQVGIQLGYGW